MVYKIILCLLLFVKFSHTQESNVNYFEYFSKHLSKYAPKMRLNLTEEYGIHLVANEPLDENEVSIRIPTHLILSNCKLIHFLLRIYSL